jgi:hypothetical protein
LGLLQEHQDVVQRVAEVPGFPKDEKTLLEATSPFAFSIVPERTMLRFLKLIACDNVMIGTYAKLVDDRNQAAYGCQRRQCHS